MYKCLLKKTSWLIALFVATSSIAMAQGYGGLSGGKANWNADCTGTTSCNNSDTSFKVFGGYDFTPNFAVEGALVSLGTAKATVGAIGVELKATGFELAGVGKAPLSSSFALFGKLGLSLLNSDAKATLGSNSASKSERGANLLAGIGASYAFSKNVSARAEFETRKVKAAGDSGNVSNFTVGVQFNF